MFPAKEVFKKFGSAGLLGINKPTEYGGLGLDYKYQLAFLEACGYIRSGGVASNTDNFNKKHVFELKLRISSGFRCTNRLFNSCPV